MKHRFRRIFFGNNIKNNNKRRNQHNIPLEEDFDIPPPPSFTPNTVPHRSCGLQKAATPGALEQHMHCYIYVWLNDNDHSFWMYPVKIDKDVIYGYIWDGYEWVYTYIYLPQIVGFY